MQTNKKGASHAPDWDKVKNEYIASQATMRELSRKYDIPVSTISKRAKREGWQKTVQQIVDKSEQKIVERISDRRASNADKAMLMLDKLMDKLMEGIESVDKKDISGMKQLVTSMKDLKEIGLYDIQTKTQDISIEIKDADEYAD